MNGATSPEPIATAVLPQGSRRTFVCYSRRDLEFVMDLASRLHERGVGVWLDLWDIDPGDDWDRTIDAAIRGCAAFLIVLSPDAVRSDEVRGELRVALNHGKAVVPVLHRPCDIPRQLQNTHYLDLTDAGDVSEAVLDDLAAALQGEPRRDDEHWRHWRRAVMPLDWAGGRLRALGASAAGIAVLLAGGGLLSEAAYARLLGIEQPSSPGRILSSGVQFFIALLLVALLLTLAAAVVLVLAAMLARAGRRLLSTTAVRDRLATLLGRPRLLWGAQGAAYVLLFFVSVPAFAGLLPLDVLAFPMDLMDARLDSRSWTAYPVVVLHVVTAIVAVGALEAWRRRLQRGRQFRAPNDARVSLVLAVPLYLLVSAELLLLPIGHGLLWLPSRREYTYARVTFNDQVPYVQLKGHDMLLVELRPGPRYAFYCPYGSATWEVDEGTFEWRGQRKTATLKRLLKQFRSHEQCQLGDRSSEEVAP